MVRETGPHKSIWQRLRPLLQWVLLFAFLMLAIWAATQSRNAPVLILLAVLYLIAINFSLPPASSSVGMVPVVAVSSLLVLGLPSAAAILIIGTLLAEISRPIWQPIGERLQLPRPSRQQRLVPALIHLLALLAGAVLYQRWGGALPLATEYLNDLSPFMALSLGFGLVYVGLHLVWWLVQKRPFLSFLNDSALSLVSAGFLAQPFAILGGVTFVLGGLPVYVGFCLGVAVFSVIIWLSWQRRYTLEQQLAQFAALNRSGDSLRETLDLPEVLDRAHHLVEELIGFDRFSLYLFEEPEWFVYRTEAQAQSAIYEQRPEPLDDFVTWVVDNGRILDLDPGNLHFATEHDLTIPEPRPAIWLGLPLTSAEDVIGVMVLQRFFEPRPFSQWDRELLRSVAAQTGAAIQNARLYRETVRLYNLTDEALADRLHQLQALLNAMTEGVLMLDPNGVVVLINPMAKQLFGDNAPQPYQRLDTAVSAPALGFAVDELKHHLSQMPSKSSHGDLEHHLYTLPGQTAEAQGQRIIDRQEIAVIDRMDHPLGRLFLLRDVTEEQELAERREDLTRMIVHDLRNPLTTIASTILTVQQQLGNGLEAQTPQQQTLGDARAASLDLLDMVDSLMDINRMEAGQSIVDADAMRLPPILEKVTRRLQPLLTHKHISLNRQQEENLPAIWADSELVRRVLVNLMDNALKFTPANGRITIIMQAEPAHNHSEPGVRCIIRDTGPGIPAEFREQLFDRFMRTNIGGAQVRGTGLGLTFCKMAVEAQHGRIWVEDAPESGTQFVFILPGIPDFD